MATLRLEPQRSVRAAFLGGAASGALVVGGAIGGWWLLEAVVNPEPEVVRVSTSTPPLTMRFEPGTEEAVPVPYRNPAASTDGVPSRSTGDIPDEPETAPEETGAPPDEAEAMPDEQESTAEEQMQLETVRVEAVADDEEATPEATEERVSETTPPAPDTAREDRFPHGAPPLAEEALVRADLLVEAGRSREAMDEYRRALILDVHMDEARIGYARILASSGRTGRAREVLGRGLEREPDNRVLATHYATLAVEDGDEAAAQRVLEAAVSDERVGEVEQQLAHLYRHGGRYTEARALYARLADDEPDNAQWWSGLGLSAERAGDGAAALTAWRRLLEVDGIDPELRRWAEGRVTTLERD